jgi:hypothetical protein
VDGSGHFLSAMTDVRDPDIRSTINIFPSTIVVESCSLTSDQNNIPTGIDREFILVFKFLRMD